MPVKATPSSRFITWLAVISFICLGIGLWFLWDGTITYPRQRERALTYQRLEKDGQLDQWKAIATERGWSRKDPGKPKSNAEIYAQRVLGTLAVPPGLFYLFMLLRSRGRWIELNGTAIRTSWGQQFEISQITTLEKKKWKSKGIARINYQQDGRELRLVLDDWKYESEATTKILREVEAQIDVEQIIGGLPEPPGQDEQE